MARCGKTAWIGLSFCSAGLPPRLRKTCGTLVRSAKIRGSPHKPRGPALQILDVSLFRGTGMTPQKDLHATSIERAFAILEFLDGSRRGWNISELSRKLRIPKSTTHVIVLTLQRLG